VSSVRCFPPVAAAGARLLILGSMPGLESLRAGEYYAHPRNAFWPILAGLTGIACDAPYAQRISALRAQGIALWDVLASCTRPGSLDSAIDSGSVIVNDLQGFLLQHPQIRDVLFNGAAAERFFLRHVAPGLEAGALRLTRLPSTSPAHAARSLSDKRRDWHREIKKIIQ
jgi:TDG/mug DNA glycosylase family protein